MKLMKISFVLLALAMGLVFQQSAEAQYAISKSVFGNGGTTVSNGHRIMGTLGQPAIGVSSNPSNNIVYSGFWYTVSYSPSQLPEIGVTPSSLSFSAIPGGANPPSQTLSITNTGSGVLNWAVSDDAGGWLSMSPTSGDCTTETDEVTVSVDITGLAEGTYNATITIGAALASNTPQTVPVTLNCGSYQCDFEPGWNLFSLPIDPSDTDLDVVLQSIVGQYISVWEYDAASHAWKRFIVGAPDFLNNLTAIEAGKGYWINMINAATLILAGGTIASDPVPLEPGWNLVGYNCMGELSRDDALLSIAGNYVSVWAYDAVSHQWERYIVGAPDFLNTLDSFDTWKGYWIDTTIACVWTLDACPIPAAPPAGLATYRDSTPRPGIPYTIWGSIEVDGMRPTHRDAPIVLLKIDNEIRASCQLRTEDEYGDLYVMDVPANTSGSAQVELCVRISDTVMKTVPVPIGKSSQVIRFDLSVQTSPETSLLCQNYPNPFNPDTWIPYQLKEDARVTIRIYAVTGQLVRTLNLGRKPAGFYVGKEKAAYWDGKNEIGEHTASGVYFYILDADDFKAVRKLIIVK